ncbi:hypothetical protein A2851_03940 [Candidatus Kaiserbacteria bacterium RIFCSPHIGHO2_01_FULL_53_29]|uniref:Probable membrane transporter protein n=1 Tax=Candidatus Kaiserbacteria bacterium RIFCSPHIGHO2_01_FULL_53_29 TaxID=1798480 RepID=A0A1F6CU95_9BACT|nr:MAG: hypothetical protein A2851_03940 [Candidatus Kaiserbacteria bacterium RIFCSPHIGHO2_01_FULL_53_29]
MLEFLAVNPYVFFGIILLASVLSTSFGIGGFVLIPLIAAAYGAREAIGIITLYFVFQNINKGIAFRKHIDWSVAIKMTLWSLPGALLGSFALSFIPISILNKILAIFILIYLANDVFEFVPKKHYSAALIPVFGTLYGFVSGLTSSGNIIKGPLFTSLGLSKEAYNGTYAVSSFFVNVPKLVVYFVTGVIGVGSFTSALPFFAVSILGTYIGVHLLHRVKEDVFYYFLTFAFAASAIALLFA